jgi:hypothetical protein
MIADMLLEHFHAAFDLRGPQFVAKLETEDRDNLIGGEMHRQDPVYSLDAWFSLGDRAERCIDRTVRGFANQKLLALAARTDAVAARTMPIRIDAMPSISKRCSRSDR